MLTLLSCVSSKLHRFDRVTQTVWLQIYTELPAKETGSPNYPISRAIKFRTYSKNIDPRA